MNEDSPFNSYVVVDASQLDPNPTPGGVRDDREDPGGSVLDCSSGLSPLPLRESESEADALGEPLGESVRVAVAFPVAIALPESGEFAHTLGISFPGGSTPISVTLTETDADTLRLALSVAYFESLAESGELPLA